MSGVVEDRALDLIDGTRRGSIGPWAAAACSVLRRTVAFTAELLRSEDSWSTLQESGAGQLMGPAPRATTEGLAASFPPATTEGPAAPPH